MAVIAGTITTRVLLPVGDTEPVEVATIDVDLHPGDTDSEVVLTSRRWRLRLALGFLRIAWGTATMRGR